MTMMIEQSGPAQCACLQIIHIGRPLCSNIVLKLSHCFPGCGLCFSVRDVIRVRLVQDTWQYICR